MFLFAVALFPHDRLTYHCVKLCNSLSARALLAEDSCVRNHARTKTFVNKLLILDTRDSVINSGVINAGDGDDDILEEKML